MNLNTSNTLGQLGTAVNNRWPQNQGAIMAGMAGWILMVIKTICNHTCTGLQQTFVIAIKEIILPSLQFCLLNVVLQHTNSRNGLSICFTDYKNV